MIFEDLFSPSSHITTNPVASTMGFTHPNDEWISVYIKLCLEVMEQS